MIGHSKELLATLGIDVWIPRTTVCQEWSNSSSIWRDQAPEGEIIHHEPMARVEEEKPLLKLKQAHTQKPSIDTFEAQVTAKVVEELDVQTQNTLDEITVLAPFQLQALILNHMVLVADVTAFEEKQQQLWLNIQRSLQAEFVELAWPFTLPDLQDDRGVGNYIQGFLTAIALHKTVVTLGEIPYLNDASCVRLPTVNDMLQQPLLKRDLWMKIQNK